MMKHIFNQVCEMASPFIKHFRDDLYLHDRHAILTSKGEGFLHFTGDTGTCLVFFSSPEDYPKVGERVPYLFGTANREHILCQKVSTVDYMPNVNRQKLVLHYGGNGGPVKEITQQQAQDLIRVYRHGIYAGWRKEKSDKQRT